MFETLTPQDEFIKTYQVFRASVAKLDRLLVRGEDDPFERLRHAKLQAKVDELWCDLSPEVRDKLTDILILRKMMPSEVRDVLNVMGGEVRKVT